MRKLALIISGLFVAVVVFVSLVAIIDPQSVQPYAFKVQQIVSSSELDLFAGGTNQKIVLIPTGTAKVQGPFADSGGQVFNVLAYGADPTGSLDSTSAIQSAATAAGTGSIYFPCGTYLLSANTTITITPGGGFSGEGTQCVTINWTGAGVGPVFASTAASLTGGGSFEGLTISNTTGNASLIGIQTTNLNAPHFDHLVIGTPNGGYWVSGACLKFIQTNGTWSERGTIGSDVQLYCSLGNSAQTGDLVFYDNGGTSSFGYWVILGSHLDGHAIDVSGGAKVYHMKLMFQTNTNSQSTLITLEDNGSGISNGIWDVRGESDGPGNGSLWNIASGTLVSGQGNIDVEGEAMGTVTGALFISGQGDNSDAGTGATQHQFGLVPGSVITTLLGCDETFQTPTVCQGIYGNQADNLGGEYILGVQTDPFTGRLCSREIEGSTASGGKDVVDVCDDHIQMPYWNIGASGGPRNIHYSDLSSSPFTLYANGTALFCADCTNTATDSHTAGAACAGSGHGAEAIMENGQYNCF